MGVDDDGARALEDQRRRAAEMLEQSLMRALGNVEAEPGRVVRTGQADLGRLATLFLETIAWLANSSAPGGDAAAPAAGSANQVAAAIARAVLRGTRFS